MLKVYLQALVLAALGVGIAVADRSLRPTPTVERAEKPADKTPAAAPAGKDAPKGGTPETPKDPPSPDGGKPAAPQPPAATPPTPGPVDVSTLGEKVTLAQAFALFSAGATFIDGRKPEEFAVGRVRDAMNLRNEDVQQNSQAWQDFFQSANLDSGVYVVYCYGKDCHEADQLRQTLAAVRFKKAYVMEASLDEWKAAGYPVQ